MKPSIRVISDIIDRLASKPLTERALDAAKKQFIGQLVVASDNNEALALSVGKSFLYHGTVESNAATAAHIAAVTAQQLMDAASMITPDKASILTFK